MITQVPKAMLNKYLLNLEDANTITPESFFE
jgi:hypothetical protein